MLSCIKQVESHRLFHQTRCPDYLQEKVEVRLKQMNDAQSMYTWFTDVFFDEYVGCITPPFYRDASGNCNVQERGKSVEKKRVLNQSFIVTQMAARGGGAGGFLPPAEAKANVG